MIWSWDELGIDGFTLNAQATVVVDATAPTPTKCLNLDCSTLNTASASRTINAAQDGLVIGQTYPVWAWVNFDAMAYPGVPVRFYFEDLGFDVTMNKNADVTGWELRHVGDWAFVSDGYRFFIQGLTSPGVLGAIKVDAVYIGEIPFQVAADMARKWSAIAAAINAMKGINGVTDNYNVDFEGRVYSRLFLPTEQPTVTLPYACVPLNQEGETVSYEGFAFLSSFRLSGWAFFADNPESDVLDSAGGVLAAKFRDDLIRAFMADQTLGGQAQNVEVTSIDTGMGDIGDPTTWVTFTIEFTQQAGADDLQAA